MNIVNDLEILLTVVVSCMAYLRARWIHLKLTIHTLFKPHFLFRALHQATRISPSGVRIIRTLVLLLRLHTLVTHIFSSLNYLLLEFLSLIVVCLIMLLVIKFFFSSLFTSSFLPTVTFVNGTETWSKGIDTIQILPTLYYFCYICLIFHLIYF